MKKSLLILLLLFCFLSILTKAQKDSIPQHPVLFDIGGQTSCFFGDKYIMPDTTNTIPYSTTFLYIGYSQLSATSIHYGFYYRYIIKEWFIFNFGMIYNNCKFIYKSDSNNLIKYLHFHGLNYEVVRYDISNNGFAANAYFGCYFHRFSFNIGMKLFLANIVRVKKTYLNGNNIIDQSSFHTLFSRYNSEKIIFPSFRVSYTFKIKNYNPSIYLGIDDFIHFKMKNKYNFWIYYGIELPILPDIFKPSARSDL